MSPGDLFGARYRVIAKVGQGGTAEVFLAHDLLTAERVAVKQLSREAAVVPDLRRCFLSEARAALAISHPNVVRVLASGGGAIEELLGQSGEPEGLVAERPYLVLEALDGETLAELLARGGKPSRETALMICRETALGLAAAHRAGVVHRDVKPGNLFLVGPVGAPTGVCIIDFGMATLGDGPAESDSGIVLGTVQYMPPEQALADPVDARSDIYSLGVVMFALFTGHLPFDAHSGPDLLSHQVFSPMPPPTWIEEHLDPSLEAMILRATRKHPVNRYQTMEDFLADLDALEESDPEFADRRPSLLPPSVPDFYSPRNQVGQRAANLLARSNPSLVPRTWSQSPPPVEVSSPDWEEPPAPDASGVEHGPVALIA